MKTTTTILLVEDDDDIAELVAIYLQKEGFKVDSAPNAERGMQLFEHGGYDLLLSDIMLPGMDGLELVRLVRESSDIPIILMTSKKTPQDVVAGLKQGGDDYVTKPFEPEVLVARVQAALRRCAMQREQDETGSGGSDSVWTDGWLTIDLRRLEVLVNGAPAVMPAKELQLLLRLFEYPKQVFSVRQLYESIWSIDGLSDERTVMVHIHNLRKKIEKDPAKPEYIVTIRGFGYKFGIERSKR